MAEASSTDEGTLGGQVRLGSVLARLLGARQSCMVRVEGGVPLGLIWLRDGRLLEARVGEAVGEHALFTLLALESGKYWVQFGDVDMAVGLRDGGADGLKKVLGELPEWVRLRSALPPGSSLLAVDRTALSRDAWRLTPQDPALLKALHEGCGLNQLSKRSGLPELVVLRRLLNLIRLEVIHVSDQAPGAQDATPTASTGAKRISSYPPPLSVDKPRVGYSLQSGEVTEAVTVTSSSKPPPVSNRSGTPPSLFAVHAPQIARAPKLPTDLVPADAYRGWTDSPALPSANATPAAPPNVPSTPLPYVTPLPSPADATAPTHTAPPAATGFESASQVPGRLGFNEHQLGAAKVFSSLPQARRLDTTKSITSVPLVHANKWVYRGAAIGSLILAAGVAAGSWAAGQPLFGALALLPLGLGAALQAQLIYKMWQAIQDGRAELSPGRAVALLFVPVFGLYWLLRVLPGYASAFNAFIERHQISTPRLSKHLILAAVFVPVAGLIAYWIVIGQICAGIEAIALHVARRRSEPPAIQKT